jgi:hypothetical protein
VIEDAGPLAAGVDMDRELLAVDAVAALSLQLGYTYIVLIGHCFPTCIYTSMSSSNAKHTAVTRRSTLALLPGVFRLLAGTAKKPLLLRCMDSPKFPRVPCPDLEGLHVPAVPAP